MEPTDNLFGGYSLSGHYGCPAGTFNQQEHEEDLMSSSLFFLSDSPVEGFPGLDNFGDGQISPLDEMPNIPFSDGQILPLDGMPCIPAAVAEETNYTAAPPAPLVATRGTETGRFSSDSSLSSTKSDEFDEEEIQQAMISLQHFLHPLMAPDGLSNTPAVRSHADDAVPMVQQGIRTTADELPHPQQQLSLIDEEVQIQQMTTTILPSQRLPSPTSVINPGPDEANHAASAPMGSQGTLIPAATQHQEANIMSRASTRRRSRGLPSRIQNGRGNFFGIMVIDMIRQLGRYIGKIMEEEKHRSPLVWQHFWSSHCKYCGAVAAMCQYCNTAMKYRSTILLSRHLESCDNYIHLLRASSGASKETQRSSPTLQIKQIAENPNGENKPIETDNCNCTTAVRMDMQGTNAVVLCQFQQLLRLLMDLDREEQMLLLMDLDREEQMTTFLSSLPCCRRGTPACRLPGFTKKYVALPGSWWDVIIRLSDSSSTTESTHNGFRLKFSDVKETDDKTVQVHSSAAWLHAIENPKPYKDHAGVFLATISNKIGRSFLSVSISKSKYDWKSAPAGCAYPWECMHHVLRALGFKQEFARDSVIYALGWVNGCNLRLRSPSSSNKGKRIVAQGDMSLRKRKRKSARTPSKVWNHFTKKVVEAEGSMVTMARCNYCPSELKADSAGYGTSHLKRHITSIHPEHAKSL